MMKIKQLTYLLIIVILTSCTTTKLLTSTVKPDDIRDLQKFETLSYITLIEKANQGKYNDTLSNTSKELFSDVLNSFGNRIQLTGNISVDESLTKKRIEREVEYLCLTADRKKIFPTLN